MTYSNSTWQNRTFDAARSVARGDRGRLSDFGLSLGLFSYPEEATTNADLIPKTALQYIENHDHERFLCNYGMQNPDEAGNPLFQEGDRDRWYMLQPYLIALLMSKGVPMLWQGEEFAENYFLPEFGSGRVSLLRPLRWDYFYDGSGQSIVTASAQAATHPARAEPDPARKCGAVEYRWAQAHYNRLPELVTDLVGRKVDVIAATGANRRRRSPKRLVLLRLCYTCQHDRRIKQHH
jgi:1,4-alpha-glucan branching enzyme